MNTYKITAYIKRSCSIGVSIYSPSLNGFYIEFELACFGIRVWSRGNKLFKAENYWRG